MGNSNTSTLQQEEVDEIEKETGFGRKQIERLHKRFTDLDKDKKGYLDREDFMNIHELAMNPLGDRLVDAFFTEAAGHPDKNYRDYSRFDDDSTVNFRQFVRVLAYFRPISLSGGQEDLQNRTGDSEQADINSRENKLRFAFSMYDLNKNNFITRDEFKFILNIMIGANISQEQLDSICDRIILEADMNRDGRISFEEFCRAMDRIDVEHKMSIRFIN